MVGAMMAAAVFTPRRLVAGLGGDVKVKVCVDSEMGKTLSTLNVTAWADFRGAGFGPSLTDLHSNLFPTIASTAPRQPVVWSGTGDPLAQALATLAFAGTVGSMLAVLSTTFAGSASNGSAAVLGGCSGNATDLYLAVNTTPHWEGNIGTADTVVDSGVARTSGQIVTTCVSATGTTGASAVGGTAAVTGTIATSANTTEGCLVLGGYSGQTLGTNPVQFYMALVMTTAFTATQQAWARLFGQRRHGSA